MTYRSILFSLMRKNGRAFTAPFRIIVTIHFLIPFELLMQFGLKLCVIS